MIQFETYFTSDWVKKWQGEGFHILPPFCVEMAAELRLQPAVNLVSIKEEKVFPAIEIPFAVELPFYIFPNRHIENNLVVIRT